MNLVAFNGPTVRELAAQFLALAEKQQSAVPLMVGHRLMSVSLTHLGDFAKAREHSERAMRLYDPIGHRPLAMKFGQDIRVAILSYYAWASWFLGYPDAALAATDQALTDAREIGHVATLLYALVHASMVRSYCGNDAQAYAEAGEAVASAIEKGSPFWAAFGKTAQGCLSGAVGKSSDEAVQTISSGLDTLRSTGTAMWRPYHLACLGKAHAEVGNLDYAWRCITEAVATIDASKERWCEAEVYRIGGELALKSPVPQPTKAEAHFERALAVARQQHAKSWELRASTSLARLWRDQGKEEQARELLAPVYGWFTEGFDTRDLKEAKALLEELAS